MTLVKHQIVVITAILLIMAGSMVAIADPHAQCPGYITQTEATEIAKSYAAQQNRTYMDEETVAIWLQSQWLVEFQTDPVNSDDRIYLTIAENGKVLSCATTGARCADTPNMDYAKCPVSAENRLTKGQIAQAAKEFLTSQAISFSEDRITLDFYEAGHWSVFFLGSLKIGDHFSITVSRDGEVLRYVGGA